MTQTKTDPRIARTRKLIMDSFITLSGKKEFKDITVKEITEVAMINRATFYYHFEDIYDLLEKTLNEVLSIDLNVASFVNAPLNEETFTRIFIAIINFQKSLSARCHREYEAAIARIVRDQLEVIFYKMLAKESPSADKQVIKITSVMISWALYGAAAERRRNGNAIPPEDFIQSTIPFMMSGIQFGLGS